MNSIIHWIFLSLIFLSSSAEAKVLLDLVCNNTIAVQINFQKNEFDSYKAATDSASTRYQVFSTGEIKYFYPADKASSSQVSGTGIVLQNKFHNLEPKQAYLEGIMESERYIENTSFHRNKYDEWVVQVTRSGNNENKLFHRMSFYECLKIEDNVPEN